MIGIRMGAMLLQSARRSTCASATAWLMSTGSM